VNLASITHLVRHTWDPLPRAKPQVDGKFGSVAVEQDLYPTLHAIYYEMGTLLRLLHTRKAPKGHFCEYSSDLSQSTNRVFSSALDYHHNNKWAKTPRHLFLHLLGQKAITSDDERKLLRWYEQFSPVLATIQTPVLCHGDYDDANVLVGVQITLKPRSSHEGSTPVPSLASIERVEGGGVTGIVDWGDSCWGPAEEDLACMYLKHYGTWAWESFLQGYGSVSLECVKVYAFLRLLWTTDAHDPEDLQNVRQLGLLQQFMSEVAAR